jgi:tRNA G18 (ribose-2'-O)-methylase SpoU
MSELGRLSIQDFKYSEKLPIIIVLDSVRSALNVGSVFRTADAFAVEKILLCGITATPPHREILKTALGSTESVDWQYFTNIEDAIISLKTLATEGGENWQLLAVEQVEGSTMLHEFEAHEGQKYALIFGNEVEGVSEIALQSVDKTLEIPQFGTKHSLNIAVSVGIVTWELARKLRT